MVLAVALGLAAANALRSCSTAQKSPYDWANLSTNGSFYAYTENGQVVSSVGVDVSDHQGQIDWNAVAQSGVEFAFVRVGRRGTTEGSLYADKRYRENIQQAQQAGLTVGAYFFSQATTEDEARQEAAYLRQLLEGLELTGPVAFDLEVTPDSRISNLTQKQASACARAFCQEVADLGTGPILYGNKQDLQLFDRDLLRTYPIWYAEYHTAAPASTLPFTYWQYTESGQVPGISTPVDVNLRMKNA